MNSEQQRRLKDIIENLIVGNGVEIFLFGSRSSFNYLCRDLVTEFMEEYPHIKRVYVRAEYPDISEDYEKYLLECYEETYFPENIRGAGRAVYVERNIEMINSSGYCIFYYDEKSSRQKSGTWQAYEYARKKGKTIINVYE